MTTETNKAKNQRPVPNSMNTAIDDLKSLVKDAEAVLANAGDAASEQVNDLQTRMRDALHSSRSRLHDLKESAREHIDECEEYVQSHPYQSIGAAVAIGALLGVLLGRRTS